MCKYGYYTSDMVMVMAESSQTRIVGKLRICSCMATEEIGACGVQFLIHRLYGTLNR